MPCSDGLAYERDIQESVSRDNKKLASLLCSTCRALEKEDYDFDLNPRLSEWWAEHKKEDEERERKALKVKLEKQKAFELARTKKIVDLTQQEKNLLRKYKLL